MTGHETTVFDKTSLPVSTGVNVPEVLCDIYREFLVRLKVFLQVIDADFAGYDVLYMEIHNIKASSISVGALHLHALVTDIGADVLSKAPVEVLMPKLREIRRSCIQTSDVMSKYLQVLNG